MGKYIQILKKPFDKKFVIILLILVGVVIYANTLANQMFWDDHDIILNNVYIQDWKNFPRYFTENMIAGAGLLSDYWRPMLLSVFSFQWKLWQDWAAGYHFVNMSFHIADAILLFFILYYIFKNKGLAILTALVFLVHPLQTEAVTYVSGLGDSLSVFFMFLSIFFFIKFRDTNKSMLESKHYYLTLLMYVFALMTKETAIILPGLIFLTDFFLPRLKKESLKEKIINAFKMVLPFLLLAGIYMLLRTTVFNFKDTFNLYGEENIFTQNFHYRLFTFFRVLTVYIGLLFWPFNLHMERTVEVATSFTSFSVIFGAMVLMLLLILGLTQFKKRPVLSFGVFWFLFTLFPTSNIVVVVNDLIYEHWLYLPLIGIFLILIWLGQQLGNRFQKDLIVKKEYKSISSFLKSLNVVQKFLLSLFLLFLVFLSVLTIRRNREWRDPITFYNQTLEYAPNSYRVINNLGMAYADVGDYVNAGEFYRRAIEVDSANAVAYHNLANNYKETGYVDVAIQGYKKAVSVDPTFLFSYYELFNIYIERDEYDLARDVLEQSLDFTDNKLDILMYLAELSVEFEDYQVALNYLENALVIYPRNSIVLDAITQVRSLMEVE